MNRLAALVAVFLIVPAHAETPSPAGFNARLATDIYTAALAFMAPRILEPVPMPQLTHWGLGGLTALDPGLSVGINKASLVLGLRDRIVLVRPLPNGITPGEWAAAAADLAAAAWPVSEAVRRAGTGGVVQSFFDEVFSHLDPYSRYVPPAEADADRGRRGGQAGIGLTPGTFGGIVVVADVVADGPGAAAGIRAGDRIIAVDGRPTQGRTARAVSGALAGADGTPVRVEWRGRDGKTRRAVLERATVAAATVFAERAGTLLVVRVTAFTHRTQARLARDVGRALAGPKPVEGIVLDLRGNRGGLLREAVTAADILLPAGVVGMTAGRDPAASRVWRSVGGSLAPAVPVVVIVDGRTASAAEVLAAALADRGRAVVVGSATLGKGLIQAIAPMPDGGELFVSWSRVLAPLGWPIQGLGVLPQVCTSLGRLEVERELNELAAGRQPMANSLALHRRARAPVPPAEVVAIRSACPSTDGRDSDLATARFLIGHPGAYATALLPPMRETAAGR